ncbi:MAG: cytochrome c, partial [Thauera sp.]|nr:cytochrome c [Thauera sp.]
MKSAFPSLAALAAAVLSFSSTQLAAQVSAQVAAPQPAQRGAIDVQARYAEHCAVCHADNRLGGMGPALLPDNLARLRKGEALEVISKGRPATQMEGFADRLN